MMYVEFMKNLHLLCFNKLLAVRLISVSWAQKRLIPCFYICCASCSKKFCSRRFEQANGCYTHFGLLSPKTFDSFFLDKVDVDFMKNFLLADTIDLMAVWIISASWAQKIWFLLFRHDVRRVDEKFSSKWMLDSFRPPEPKNVWFLLSRQGGRRFHEKFSSRRYDRSDGCLNNFGLLSPKNLIPTF